MSEDYPRRSDYCACSLPPGSTYYHCRSCCSTYMTLSLFDEHRDHGACYELEGVILENGVYGTPEGHAKRKMLSERFSR